MNKLPNFIPVAYIVLFVVTIVFSQRDFKRSRGEGLFNCNNANTVGKGNVWVDFRALGFLWDSDPTNENLPEPFAFPEVKVDVGVLDFISIQLESRIVSYGWHYDWFKLGSKYTLLDNKDIRFQTIGLQVDYTYRLLPNISSSIAGYHNSTGTGFCPEGFIVHGSSMTFQALYDIDFLTKISSLPLKISTNIGCVIPLNYEFREYSQYLLNIGLAYIGIGADVFVEYSLSAFVNKTTEPKKFEFYWPGWYNKDKKHKIWEVAFSENPMYLTLGGRVRYANGIVLSGAIPLLLSQNIGSAMTEEDKVGLKHGKFPDEILRGVTDPFDPWYPKWKIIIDLSYPIRYRRTSAEMHRNFLLLKNRKIKTKIDIDERLKTKNNTSEEEEKKLDRKKRLEEIQKRRKKFENPE